MATTKKSLTADAILGEATRELVKFPMPALKGVVYLREMLESEIEAMVATIH